MTEIIQLNLYEINEERKWYAAKDIESAMKLYKKHIKDEHIIVEIKRHRAIFIEL